MAGAGVIRPEGYVIRWQSCDSRDGRWEFVYRMRITRPDGEEAQAVLAFDDFDAFAFSSPPDDPVWLIAGEPAPVSMLAELIPGIGAILRPMPGIMRWP